MNEYKRIASLNIITSKMNGLRSRITQKLGLNEYEVKVLYALKNSCLSQKEICINCGMPKQTVNKVINSLLERKLVKQVVSELDKREKNIYLTSSGNKYLDNTLKPLLDLEERIITNMGENNYENLLKYLNLYVEAIEKEVNE